MKPSEGGERGLMAQKLFRHMHVDNMYVEDCGMYRAVFTYRGRQYDGFGVIRGLFRDYAVNMWYGSNWEICVQVDTIPKKLFSGLTKVLKAA